MSKIIYSILIMAALLLSFPALAQSLRFNDGWQFKSKEFIDQARIDSFRKLGENWNDQFIIMKENKAADVVSSKETVLNEVLQPVENLRWQAVNLPHTAFPEPLVIVKPREGLAYYRKTFFVPSSYKGKCISIEFEGAMQVSDVWFNGKYAGRYEGGYLPFVIDLTARAAYGNSNEIVLLVKNKANPVVPPGKPVEKLDFVYYSGIYRDVWLHVTDPVHITNAITAGKQAGGGIFVTYPQVSSREAKVEVQTDVVNSSVKDVQVSIRQEIVDTAGRVVATVQSGLFPLKKGKDLQHVQSLKLTSPRLWHPDHPYLYTLRTTVYNGSVKTDTRQTRIGIRSFEIVNGRGLLINGEPYRLTGTNRHQNYPYIGNAISDEASYRDAWLIKASGMNAIRCAHYPPDPSFLDAADELGLLLINAIPGWQYFNKNQAFQDNVMKDIRQTIRRDRNHASVLLWETSLNETYPDSAFRCKQAEVARQEWRGEKNFFTSGDSYYTKACYDVPYDDWNGDPGARSNTTYKDRPFLIREYGDYEFGGGNSTTRQLRSAGEQNLLQQAWNLQWEHNKNRKIYPASLGDLTWAFFDGMAGCVVGIEGWGVADIFRIPKYSYFLYKSQQPAVANWNIPIVSGPFVYIASNWDQQSIAGKVIVYSNCDSVTLQVDDQVYATRLPDQGPETPYGEGDTAALYRYNGGNANHLDHPPFTFTGLPFKPGSLKATGYLKGKPAATYTVSTPAAAHHLELTSGINGKAFHRNGDVLFIYAKVTDHSGNTVTASAIPVTIKVDGDATLLSPATVAAEAGIATFVIRSGNGNGEVKISATANALQEAKLELRAE